MGAARKHRNYYPRERTQSDERDKAIVEAFVKKIQGQLESDEKARKKAALIFQKMINSNEK